MSTLDTRPLAAPAAAAEGLAPEAASKMLRKVGLKVTRSRLAMLDLLARRQTHMSADEITDTLREEGHAVDRVTVYRNLDKMLDRDLLAMVYIPGRAMRVGLRRNPGSPHHHFIVCEKTGRVEELDTCFLQECWDYAAQRIQEKSGWELTGHVMQYVGVAPDSAGGNGKSQSR